MTTWICRKCQRPFEPKEWHIRHGHRRCYHCANEKQNRRRAAYRAAHPAAGWRPSPFVSKIEEMATAGVPPSQIRRELQVTAGVVSGIIWRAREMGRIPDTRFKFKPYEPPHDPFSERGGCQFMAGDPRDPATRCCGLPVNRWDSSYCAEHHAIAYRPTILQVKWRAIIKMRNVSW